jgi:hypothetical protein
VGASIKTPFNLSRCLITVVLSLGVLQPLTSYAQTNWCRCPGGAVLQPGLVNYKGSSDRELVTRIETREADPEHRCEAAWITYSEVFAEGTPYTFHLERKHVKTIREEACGPSPSRFVSRTKTYRFSIDVDSQSLRETEPIPAESAKSQTDLPAGEKSNENVWNSIATADPVDPRKSPKPATPGVVSVPEFVRTAWVLARKDIEGHEVALVRGIDQRESIVTLNETRAIRAGEVGQIEASNAHTAIVRFYAGSRTEKLASKKNAFRRWYDNIGGPYTETKDDLYSPVRACIVEVPLDDIIEVNDYLDSQKTDKT